MTHIPRDSPSWTEIPASRRQMWLVTLCPQSGSGGALTWTEGNKDFVGKEEVIHGMFWQRAWLHFA